MPHFFMHLRDSTDEVLDPDGRDMTLDAVEGAALEAARDCIAGDVRSGMVDLNYRIDVHDDAGTLVYSLSFRDALCFKPTHDDQVTICL